MRRLLAIALIAVVPVVAGCGDSEEDEPKPSPPASEAGGADGKSADEAKAAQNNGNRNKAGSAGGERDEGKGTEIATGQSQFGEIIFDGSNQAIYLFDKETTSKAECYDECADAWPPVMTKGEPQAVGGAKQKLLGTTKRKDGSLQVTYAGQPLYYYAHEGPGQVLCHNVSEYGGLWLVLDGAGDALP